MAHYYHIRAAMPKKTHRLLAFAVALLFSLATAMAIFSRANAATVPFFQGFETDTSGWNDYAGSTVTRVASGTDGVSSYEGAYHATLGLGDTVSGGPYDGKEIGPFTRWGGYESEFPEGGYTTSVAIYIDTSLADGENDLRFDYTSAINKPDGTHQRDFIFAAGTANAGEWAVSASNNAPGWPSNPARNPAMITESGWYQFVHNFRDDGTGVLEVEMQVLDSVGNVVGSWVLSDASDVIGSTVGGNRYGWFATNDFNGLAIDASEKEGVEPAVTHSFNGGGHLLEGEGKRKTWSDISFGADVMNYNIGGTEGDLTIKFHNVAGEDMDKTSFHATEITEFNYFDGDSATCESAMNLTAMGVWNGNPGYKVILRASDNGSPNTEDSVRVEVFDETDTKVYDTHSGDFSDESSCVGTARTGLDKGNLTIQKME